MSAYDATTMRVEEASLNAWPALHQMLYDGWVLRFSDGYTRRANSVNAVYASYLDLPTKIAHAERCYTERGLPVIFRLTPFSQPPGLDRVLAERGYSHDAPTIVMMQDLTEPASPTVVDVGTVRVREEAIDTWLPHLAIVRREPLLAHDTHRAILGAIAGKVQGFALEHGAETVACALAVLEGDLAGLFDLVTAPTQRNKGFASALVQAVLDWAQGLGAHSVYAQVMEENGAARHVYAKLGFSELYRYWYRVRDCTRTPVRR